MVDNAFRIERAKARQTVDQAYNYKHFRIGEGTYGVVYKAKPKGDDTKEYALKKIKGTASADGLSTSACREIALLRELKHENIIRMRNVFLNPHDKDVWLLFDYAEHDLYQIIQHHRELSAQGTKQRVFIPERMVKSLLWQILNGVHYLHSQWVLHRDLKPANILVMGLGPEKGCVKIGDLGMARLFNSPLKPLADLDPVVVTIWYRAPELLLGARHYTKAIDLWAVGCIFAELITTKPLFHGHQVEDKTKNPFQRDQIDKIISVLGKPDKSQWPNLEFLPEYHRLMEMKVSGAMGLPACMQGFNDPRAKYPFPLSNKGLSLLCDLLQYNPERRLTAEKALQHELFADGKFSRTNAFDGIAEEYPLRVALSDEKERKSKQKQDQRGSSASSHGPPSKKAKLSAQPGSSLSNQQHLQASWGGGGYPTTFSHLRQ
eukprot:Colp12_sorted_trinity150504_noHs@24704